MGARPKNRPAQDVLIPSSGRGGLISHRSHSSLVSLIRQNLADDNLRLILSSCFNHLFYLDSLKFQGQLYNLLLRSLVKKSLDRNRLCFCFGGRNIDFSPRDFCLITGLKFSEWSDPPVESEIHRTVFNKKHQISLGDIVKAFKKECQDSGGSSALSLQLAFLVMLYGVLLVVGNTNNSVDKSYLHLIDDVDKFNAFPWGSVAYMCLVKRTHRAREVLENILLKHKKIAFDANGFVLALQVWAYEVVPILSRNCATRIEGVGVHLPRVRKWAATNYLKFDFLNKLLVKSHPESLEMVKPSIEEEETLKKLGVDEFDETMASLINLDIKPLFCSNVNLTNKEALSSEVVGSCNVQIENKQSPAAMDFTAKGIADMQVFMNVVNINKRAENVSPLNLIRRHVSKSFEVVHSGRSTCQESSRVHWYDDDGNRDLHAKRPRTRLEDDAILLHYSKSRTGNLISGEAFQPVIQKSFDPNEPHFKETLMNHFEDWCSAAKKNKQLGCIVLPFYSGFPVDVNWFSPLLRHMGWLNTAHIESLLNLIWLKSKSVQDDLSRDRTFMDMGCWAGLTSDEDEKVRELVGPYVCGIKPRHGHLNWSRAGKVFGVGHVNGNHWISYMVCLDECRIIVYDSNSSSCDKLLGTFTLVARNLEKICQEMCIWEFRGMPVGKHFDIIPYESTPQQVNTADCGVLALKFFECFANDFPIDDVDATRGGVFRCSFAKQIFDLALLDSTTVVIEEE